jgi:hypothetical protein
MFAYNLAYEYGGVMYSRGYINLMNSTFEHNGAGVGKHQLYLYSFVL